VFLRWKLSVEHYIWTWEREYRLLLGRFQLLWDSQSILLLFLLSRPPKKELHWRSLRVHIFRQICVRIVRATITSSIVSLDNTRFSFFSSSYLRRMRGTKESAVRRTFNNLRSPLSGLEFRRTNLIPCFHLDSIFTVEKYMSIICDTEWESASGFPQKVRLRTENSCLVFAVRCHHLSSLGVKKNRPCSTFRQLS